MYFPTDLVCRRGYSGFVKVICLATLLLSLASTAIGQSSITQTFHNSAPITIVNGGGSSTIADPYPSAISVTGMNGRIADINVRINGLSIDSPHDLALLLVAPNGQTRMILQSDVGGHLGNINNVTYTLDDQGKTAVSNFELGPGIYRPTSVGDNEVFPQVGPYPPPVDCRPGGFIECPQPSPAGNATLNGTFGGVSPNGSWRLYAIDCCAPLAANIAGGWSLIITTTSPTSTVPLLTLNAGEGLTAEFSNYSLANYGQANGVYKGSFCFTLKNTSKRPPSQLPVFITSLGYTYSGSGYASLHKTTNYSFDGTFSGDGPLGVALHDGFPDGYVYLTSFGSRFPLSYPDNGIPTGGTASFCFALEKNGPFTLVELINEFAVVFNDGVPTHFDIYGQSNSAYIDVSYLDAGKMCFSAGACGNENITSIGFDLPGNRGPFTSVSSSPPLPAGTMFHLTTSPHRLRFFDLGASGRLDFGLLTGQLFAKGIRQSGFSEVDSNFCVLGDFSGLRTRDISNSAVIRFERDWGTKNNPHLQPCIVYQPAIRGRVASNPR